MIRVYRLHGMTLFWKQTDVLTTLAGYRAHSLFRDHDTAAMMFLFSLSAYILISYSSLSNLRARIAVIYKCIHGFAFAKHTFIHFSTFRMCLERSTFFVEHQFIGN